MAHRHKAIRESDVTSMNGMCSCPGCNNAFGRYTEYCVCGAERDICTGMGTASMNQHRAHGYSIWQIPEGHPDYPELEPDDYQYPVTKSFDEEWDEFSNF